MKVTEDLVFIGGLWMPRSESALLSTKRFARRSTLTGTLDLDVEKVAATIKHCKSFDVAVDVGAHVGAISLLLAKRFAAVTAFEAIPSTFAALERNVAGLRNVATINCAVLDRQGQTFLMHFPHHGQLSHIAGEHGGAPL